MHRQGQGASPYEFDCKVSVATPVTKPKGGQSVLHAQALQGNPCDGHTLGPMVKAFKQVTGVETPRIHVDKGYRGHNHPGEVPGLDPRPGATGHRRHQREMKRRAAVEPVIGHVKAEQHMVRNYLTGRDGDRINAILAAAGYNFHLPL